MKTDFLAFAEYLPLVFFELFDVCNEYRSAADNNLRGSVAERCDIAGLSAHHHRCRLCPFQTMQTNDLERVMDLFIIDTDQQGRIALFEEAAGSREFGKEETCLSQGIADSDRVLFIDNCCNQFHSVSHNLSAAGIKSNAAMDADNFM